MPAGDANGLARTVSQSPAVVGLTDPLSPPDGELEDGAPAARLYSDLPTGCSAFRRNVGDRNWYSLGEHHLEEQWDSRIDYWDRRDFIVEVPYGISAQPTKYPVSFGISGSVEVHHSSTESHFFDRVTTNESTHAHKSFEVYFETATEVTACSFPPYTTTSYYHEIVPIKPARDVKEGQVATYQRQRNIAPLTCGGRGDVTIAVDANASLSKDEGVQARQSSPALTASIGAERVEFQVGISTRRIQSSRTTQSWGGRVDNGDFSLCGVGGEPLASGVQVLAKKG